MPTLTTYSVSVENTPNVRGPQVALLGKCNMCAVDVGRYFRGDSDSTLNNLRVDAYFSKSKVRSGLTTALTSYFSYFELNMCADIALSPKL